MAVTLTRPTTFNLGTAVQSRLNAFKKSRGEAQTSDELEFLKQMSEKGMSNQEQLAYRQAQLEKEQGRSVPDQDYILSLKKDINELKKLARYEKLRTTYKESIAEVTSGRKSLQNHLQLLTTQLNETNDPDLRSELQTQITQTQKDIYDSAQTLLDNEITFAQNDKSISIIDSVLGKIKTEKAKALGIGDNARASALDLKIQSLEQTKTLAQVEDAVNRLTITKSRKASAIGYLQDLSNEVQKANNTLPVTINGTRYNSVQDFWSQERDKYLATNFFTDLNKEYNDYVTSVSQLNGQVPDSVLKNIQSDFVQLGQRPEMASYLSRLDIAKTGLLSSAIEKTATSIFNKFATDNDSQSALGSLERLQSQYGIDQTFNMQKVVQEVAKEKGSLVNNLMGEVSARVASGMSYSSALADVDKSLGNGEILAPSYSAKDLATKTPQDLLKQGQTSTAQNLKVGVPNLPNGNQPTQQPKTPGQVAGAFTEAPQPGLQMPNSMPGQSSPTPNNQPLTPSNPTEYTVSAGDTLSGIAKKLLGDAKKYTLIFEANKDVLQNPSLIKAGQKLKIPTNV